jgi:HEAT repeat protein
MSRRKNTSRGKARRTVPALAALGLALLFAAWPAAPEGSGLRAAAQGSKDATAQTYVDGRTLLEDENWAGAAEKFRQFVAAAAPGQENVDAALYWLAVALQKQEKFGEASQTLARLLKDFPQSSWAGSARAMHVELAGATGDRRAVEEALTDPDEDVQLIALQQLVHTDAARATSFVSGLLRPDSKAGAQAKLTAVTLLGRSGGSQATALLVEVARGQQDRKLRKAALYALGQSRNEEALDFLKGLAAEGGDEEITQAAAFAVAQLPGERATASLGELARGAASMELRHNAIMWLGQKESDAAAEQLSLLFDAAQDADTRNMCLLSLGHSPSPRAFAKLQDVAHRGEPHEARMYAILGLGERGSERGLDFLIQFYEQESDETIREWALMALGQAGQRRGLRKLMEVARGNAPERLRRAAIQSLERSSGDPEVDKFLREVEK